MTKPSSRIVRNNRNVRNFKPKGKYIICVEKNDDGSMDIWSTDSIFWRDFFNGGVLNDNNVRSY